MSDMVQKLIGADGNVILSLESGGTSAADAAGARANLNVLRAPELLWSGVFFDNTITVPGLSGYTYLIFELDVSSKNLVCMVRYNASTIHLPGFAINDGYSIPTVTTYTYKLGVNGDVLSFASDHRLFVTHQSGDGHSHSQDGAIVKIYGFM